MQRNYHNPSMKILKLCVSITAAKNSIQNHKMPTLNRCSGIPQTWCVQQHIKAGGQPIASPRLPDPKKVCSKFDDHQLRVIKRSKQWQPTETTTSINLCTTTKQDERYRSNKISKLFLCRTRELVIAFNEISIQRNPI